MKAAFRYRIGLSHGSPWLSLIDVHHEHPSPDKQTDRWYTPANLSSTHPGHSIPISIAPYTPLLIMPVAPCTSPWRVPAMGLTIDGHWNKWGVASIRPLNPADLSKGKKTVYHCLPSGYPAPLIGHRVLTRVMLTVTACKFRPKVPRAGSDTAWIVTMGSMPIDAAISVRILAVAAYWKWCAM